MSVCFPIFQWCYASVLLTAGLVEAEARLRERDVRPQAMPFPSTLPSGFGTPNRASEVELMELGSLTSTEVAMWYANSNTKYFKSFGDAERSAQGTSSSVLGKCWADIC